MAKKSRVVYKRGIKRKEGKGQLIVACSSLGRIISCKKSRRARAGRKNQSDASNFPDGSLT